MFEPNAFIPVTHFVVLGFVKVNSLKPDAFQTNNLKGIRLDTIDNFVGNKHLILHVLKMNGEHGS